MLVVELIARVPRVPWWFGWLLRLAVAAAAARVLLHASSYLTDLSGPGTAEWSSAQAWELLLGLAAALAVVWVLLVRLGKAAPGPSVPLALAVVCAGAGVTVMLSGSVSAGELGLPLAAGLAGAGVASAAVRGPQDPTGALGVAVVGLFGVLIVGRFFCELSTAHAALLGAAPLLGWLPELPGVRKWPGWSRGLLRLALVALPVAAVVIEAGRHFAEEAAAS